MTGFETTDTIPRPIGKAPRVRLPALLSVSLAVAAASAASGCNKPGASDPPPPKAGPPVGVEAAAAQPDDACAGATAQGPLRWFHDDYQAALACARAEKKPIFIDDWAPWCHTCLSMKQTVFIDPGLEPLADRFVWLAIDTDKESNADVVAKFPPQVWPTFYVVSPADESIHGRYLGAASLDQLREFITEGERSYLDSVGDGIDPDSPLGHERSGDRAVVAGDWAAAAEAYSAALAGAPADWSRRPDVLVKQISAYFKADLGQPCVALAESAFESTGRGASSSDFSYYAHICAGEIADKARAQALRRRLAERLQGIIDDPSAPLSIDDRSDGLRILREIHDALGDEGRALELAERQRDLLDTTWAKAPNAFARMTFVWPRVEVYAYLGQGDEIVADVEALEQALPTQYDPSYRLTWLFHHLERYDQALAAAKRADEKMYGPRKGRLLFLVADIHAARGDRQAERSAREAVIAHYQGLPASQQQPGALAAARAALAEAFPEQ